MPSYARPLLAALAVLVPLCCLSTAAAQAVATDKCTRECDPQAANGPGFKRGAEPVNVILFGHFEDLLNLAPLNAQPPDEQREPDVNRGFPMPSIDSNTNLQAGGTPLDVHFKNNEFTMFSSPGLVEILGDGSWRTHQEPGLASDAHIAGDEIRLYFYLSSHAMPGQTSDTGAGKTAPVGAMPQVGIYARLETGRFVNHGTLIAQSTDADTNTPGSADRVNVVTAPGQPDVYEFLVKMKVAQNVLPSSEKAAGFTLSVNPYQVKARPQGEVQVMQEEWRLRTGPRFPPRLVVPMTEPMQTAAGSLSIFDQRMFVRWSLVSSLGSYDMRDSALTLSSTGSGKIDPKAIQFIILKRSVDHDGHFKPVNATWAIDYTNFPLADGDYELTASIPNLQETYLLEHKFAFRVVDGRPQVSEIGKPGGPRSGPSAPEGRHAKSPDAGITGALSVLVVASLAAAGRRRNARF